MPEVHNKVYDKDILFVRRNEDMEIREILKNIREKNNLTQEQMAVRMKVTRQAVSRWETGVSHS